MAEKQPVPRWSEITSDERWQKAEPKERAKVRDKWLKALYKDNPKLTKKDKIDIESRTYREWDGPQQQQQDDVVAQTPQVEVNPEQFDTTLNQIAGMPPGTTVEGASVQPRPGQTEPAPTGMDVATHQLGNLLSAAPGTGVLKAFAQDPEGGALKNIGKGLFSDLVETPYNILKGAGIPQAFGLGGQEFTEEKLAKTKDVPIPKDPLQLIGYFAGRMIDIDKGIKKMKEVAAGGDPVTLSDVHKQATGKTLEEEHGKTKGTLIDILGTAATDPLMAVDAYIGMTKSAKTLGEVLLAAEKALADDKLVAFVARQPKLRKGLNLLQDAISDSKLGGKTGKITDAKIARRQPAGKQPKALPARLDRKKGEGFEIVKKALPEPQKKLTTGAKQLPAAGGTQKAIPLPATLGKAATTAVDNADPKLIKEISNTVVNSKRWAEIYRENKTLQPYMNDISKGITPGMKATTPAKLAEQQASAILKTSQKRGGGMIPAAGQTIDQAIAAAKKGKTKITSGTIQQITNNAIDRINAQHQLGRISTVEKDIGIAKVYAKEAIATRLVGDETAKKMVDSFSKQKTGSIVKQIVSDVSEKFNLTGKLGGQFAVDPKPNKQALNEINQRLNAASAELLKRFRKAGVKKYKNFQTYLREATKLTPEQQALVLKNTVQRGQKGVPAEIAATMEGATTGAQRVERVLNASELESKRLHKANKSVTQAYEKLKRAWVDVSGNLKNRLLKEGGEHGRQAVISHDLTRGASAKAGRMIEDASKELYKGLSKDEERILNKMIAANREITIARYKPGQKHPGGLPTSEYVEYMNSIPKALKDKLTPRMATYSRVMREQLKDLAKAGLISKEEFASMVSKGDYSPRRVLRFVDPERNYGNLGGRQITVPDSGLQRLKEGDYGLLEIDSRRLMQQVVARTQHRIMRNNANVALHTMATEVPDNGIVRLAKVRKQAKTGKLYFESPDAGEEALKVMIDGKQRKLIMPAEMAKEWVESDPIVASGAADLAGKLMGTKLLKLMATGINPEFALTNFPRDLAHIWLTTGEYSKYLFKAPFEMGRDIASVAKDAILRKGQYLDYINEGGGMEFMTHQGRIFGANKAMKWLGYVGETSEVLTRLALRKRAMRNGKLGEEATWIARNYLDFAQGGNLAKGADQIIPYLNASIQGSRGIVRAATTKGGRAVFAFKAAQVGTLASGLYLANRIRNPEAWKSVPPRDKVNNFIFTLNLPYKDKNGEIRYPYIKIAKDQGQRAIASVFEGLMAKYMGDPVDGEQIQQAVFDFLPILPTTAIPPLMDAILGYSSNVDFWSGEDIWRGPEVPEHMEANKYTHPGFVKFGETTGWSPVRTRFALQQFFTYGNIYTSMLGGVTDLFIDDMTPKEKEATVDALRSTPFMRKVIRATDPYTPHEKEVDKKKLDEQGRRYQQRLELDKLTDEWLINKSPEGKQKVMGYIKSQDKLDQRRLMDRVKFSQQTHKLRDKRWWLSIQSAPPEVRARLFWSRYSQVNRTEQARLINQLKKLPKIRTKRFMREFGQLKKGK